LKICKKRWQKIKEGGCLRKEKAEKFGDEYEEWKKGK
jgi:hypothetical protein